MKFIAWYFVYWGHIFLVYRWPPNYLKDEKYPKELYLIAALFEVLIFFVLYNEIIK